MAEDTRRRAVGQAIETVRHSKSSKARLGPCEGPGEGLSLNADPEACALSEVVVVDADRRVQIVGLAQNEV